MSESEGFLARWSRRKRAAAAPAPEPVTEQASAAPAEAVPPAAAEPVEVFDPASLPPIESLTAESDISAFLRPQVPAALRNAALRRVWTLDPVIRDYVGPADYAWDYNAPGGVPGFSLDLGGEVKRLLAQAIGLVEEDETPPPSAPAPTPVPETPPGEPLVLLAEAPSEQAVTEEAAPPLPPMPVRRHGSARPV